MSEFDQNTVKRNISMLLRNKSIPQKQLASAIGVTQPNLSKALNEKEKRFFTVEQIYKIAEFFGVSIDSLIGYSPNTAKDDIDFRSIGEFIVKLLESGIAEIKDISTDEVVTNIFYDNDTGYPADYGTYLEDVTYSALFFPNHSAAFEREEYVRGNIGREGRTIVNTTGNEVINALLQKYPSILKLYNEGQLSQEAYDAVVSSFLEQLEDN